MPRHNGRPYQTFRKRVLDSSDVCALCGHAVDKTLPGNHPSGLGPTVDMIVPLAHGGNDKDLSNARLAHKRCNSRRGDGTGRWQPFKTTRRW